MRQDHPPETETAGARIPGDGYVFALALGICTEKMQRTGVVLAPLAADNFAVVQKNAGIHFRKLLTATDADLLPGADVGQHAVVSYLYKEISGSGGVSPARNKIKIILHVSLRMEFIFIMKVQCGGE